MNLTISSPPFRVAESMRFGYPTRLSCAWVSLPERLVQPSMDVDSGEFKIDVGVGATHEGRGSLRNPLKRLRARSTLNLGDDVFVYDSRYETDRNISHQIQNVMARVLLARQSLIRLLNADPEIHVILSANASSMTLEAYRILGIPVILSDARVEGRVVRVTCPPTMARIFGELPHQVRFTILSLFPEIFREIRIGDPPQSPPEKVFIARKSSRFLLNDKEISQMLAGRGFRKYYFEEIPVLEQWQVLANARQIVAIHGCRARYLGIQPARPRTEGWRLERPAINRAFRSRLSSRSLPLLRRSSQRALVRRAGHDHT